MLSKADEYNTQVKCAQSGPRASTANCNVSMVLVAWKRRRNLPVHLHSVINRARGMRGSLHMIQRGEGVASVAWLQVPVLSTVTYSGQTDACNLFPGPGHSATLRLVAHQMLGNIAAKFSLQDMYKRIYQWCLAMSVAHFGVGVPASVLKKLAGGAKVCIISSRAFNVSFFKKTQGLTAVRCLWCNVCCCDCVDVIVLM